MLLGESRGGITGMKEGRRGISAKYVEEDSREEEEGGKAGRGAEEGMTTIKPLKRQIIQQSTEKRKEIATPPCPAVPLVLG
jgi:hypothetical protein